ncbi:hypothetical protein AKJ51_00595 [candidate division MSBL1 archaeon SCGC-AAA382A20]|uniref:Uncharacterized protein n=1 Tax=candidate division MSBL1 archaeon SCGC-AAA382A20 TaxID=1698280 RepID=A0A133VMN5_9EURY|nr:hypothetical protein AKJ51_00595 [candidate division MSBL1 archaeon SCGC-AAA382A20]
MSLDEEQVKKIDEILDKIDLPRSTFVNMLLEDINFVLRNIEDNPGYYFEERILSRFYSLGLIKYEELVKTLGPKRASEISDIVDSVRKYRKWRNEQS